VRAKRVNRGHILEANGVCDNNITMDHLSRMITIALLYVNNSIVVGGDENLTDTTASDGGASEAAPGVGVVVVLGWKGRT
jgi:hypothetical protein